MNPLLERSRRKVAEAAFFLDRIQETNGRQPEFGYLLSAFLSAVRSIGWVLQNDLRGRYRERFDRWWEEKKASLPTATVPFSVVVELRNQALKAGELLPGMRVAVRLDHPAVEEAAFTVDLRAGRVVTSSEEYKFRNGGAPTVQLSDPNDLEEVANQLVPALRPVFESLDQDEPPFEVSSLQYVLERAAPAVTFEDMVKGFGQHVEAMRKIVAEGDQLFSEER